MTSPVTHKQPINEPPALTSSQLGKCFNSVSTIHFLSHKTQQKDKVHHITQRGCRNFYSISNSSQGPLIMQIPAQTIDSDDPNPHLARNQTSETTSLNSRSSAHIRNQCVTRNTNAQIKLLTLPLTSDPRHTILIAHILKPQTQPWPAKHSISTHGSTLKPSPLSYAPSSRKTHQATQPS